jgi:hypothetical protein
MLICHQQQQSELESINFHYILMHASPTKTFISCDSKIGRRQSFFFIREISLKSAKRNQVHRKYTRKSSRKKKKTIQGNNDEDNIGGIGKLIALFKRLQIHIERNFLNFNAY